MSLKALRTLVTIARHGTFGNARAAGQAACRARHGLHQLHRLVAPVP